MKDRLDLENEIATIHTFADQLGALSEGILAHELTNDEIVIVLEDTRVILNLHAQKLHDTMIQCFHLDQYRHSYLKSSEDFST